jgi:acetylornithine deacetylase
MEAPVKPNSGQVVAQVEELRDYIFDSLHEIVRIPSINHPPTGDEYECQMAVARRWREMRLEPEIYPLDSVPGLKAHPSYFSGRDYQHRPNVLARRRGRGGGKSLLLSGHIDTVPLGVQPWNHAPFQAAIEAGRMYGLGAYDMKCGVAIMLGVMRTLIELGVKLKGDLLAETVVDEEFGGVNGTLAGRLRGDNADAVIITEPTDLAICNGNRGGMVVHFTLTGREGIVFGYEEPGHAIRMLAHCLKWVDVFRQRRRAKVPGWMSGPLDPVPVWVTKVSAGGWGMNVPLTVPAEARLELYYQLMPGEDEAGAKSELFAWVDEMVADKPNDFAGRPAMTFPYRFLPASEIPADAPVIQALNRCVQQVIGAPAEVRPIPAPSDLFTVQRDFGLQGIHFGPRGGGAHSADEYVELEDLLTVTKALTLLALEWCEVDEN